MKITNIQFHNFKNKNGAQELTGLDLFTGANGVGKSAVIQATELVINGVVNNVARNKEIFKFANSDCMGIKLTTDEGFEIARKFYKKVKEDKETGETSTKYTTKLEVPSISETTIKAQQDEISKILGYFPMSFDFNKFVFLSDIEKKNLILSFCKASSFDDSKIKEYLIKNKGSFNEEEYEKAMSYLLSNAEKTTDTQERVDSMLNMAKEQYSFYKKDLVRQRGVIEKLNETKSSFSVESKGLSLDKKKEEKMTEKLISLEKESSKLEKDNERAIDTKNKIDKFNSEINTLKEAKQPKTEEEIDKEIELYKEKFKLAEENNLALAKKISDTTTAYKNILEEVKKQRVLFENIKSKGTEVKIQYNTIVKLVSEVKNTKGKCAINPLIPCNADFSKWLVQKNEELVAMKKNLKELVDKYTCEEKKLRALEEKSDKITKERETLISNQQTLIKNSNMLSSKISELNKEKEQIRSFKQVKAERIKMYEKNISDLQKEKITYIDLTDKKKEIIEIKKQIEELKKQIAEKEKLQNLISQIKEANQKFDNIMELNDIYKDLTKNLGPKGLQNELFKTLVSPIVEDVNKNLKIMGIEKEFYIDQESETEQSFKGFNFGLGKISFESLSTGQQLILAVALIVAFVEKADLPMKVLCLDNIEALDENNLVKVLSGLSKLYSLNKLDNIIVAGCLQEVPKIDKVKVWDLDKAIA